MKTAPHDLTFLVPIGQQMIASGDIADALALAASLDEQNRLDLLEQIVPEQIDASDFARALKTAQTFNDAGRLTKLLAEIAAGFPN